MPNAVSTFRTHPHWVWLIPNIALVLVVASVGALLWFLHRYEGELQRNSLVRDMQWAEASAARRMHEDQEFVDRLARLVAEGTGAGALSEQAGAYLAQHASLGNFVWNAPNGSARWHVGHATHEELVRERPSTPELDRMLRLTAAMGRPTYTNAYRNSVGEAYIEYHSPVLRRGEFLGTVSTTYRLGSFLQHALPATFVERYRVVLLDLDDTELTARDRPGAGEPLLTQSLTLSLPWRDIRLVATSYKTASILGQGALILLTALLAAILVWSLWLLRRHVRKRLEADFALQASHERFVTVMDALDAAVYVADLDSGEIVFRNERFLRDFPDGTAGRTVDAVERVFAEAPSRHFSSATLVAHADSAGGALKHEFHAPSMGKWYLVRAKAIRWVDARLVRMHVVSDITERKQAEARGRQQQEKLLMTSRLMTVGEMASTLAHELNQPLAAIANYVRGCLQRLRGDRWDPEELAAALEKSAAQAERAGRIVQRARELVRRREPAWECLDLNGVVGEVARLVEIEAERNRIRIALDLDMNLGPVVADRIMMEQVLLNLVKNGIEAMDDTPAEHRTLRIATASDGNGAVQVSVIDCGHGIDAEAEAQLFSPFFSTKTDGMGLGLNLCRSIVELHDGHLAYSRNAGRGSTFRFTVPLES